MAHALERGRAHDNRQLKHPSGDMAETIFPVPNPGDAGYFNPRAQAPHVPDNSGGKATPKAGKNY